MSGRELKATAEEPHKLLGTAEHQEQSVRLPQPDLLSLRAAPIGSASTVGAHADRLNRLVASRPSQSGCSLLQLQQHYGNRYVQRVVALARKADGEAETTPGVEDVIQRARGSGQGLDGGVRAQMEPAFGTDFGDVRVHTNHEADLLNRAVNARAFTTGQDIFFRQGEYNPGSSAGRRLLAHELTHVVQQNGDEVQPKLVISRPGDEYEAEADQVADVVMRQEQPAARDQAVNTMTRIAVQRQTDAEDEGLPDRAFSNARSRKAEDRQAKLRARAYAQQQQEAVQDKGEPKPSLGERAADYVVGKTTEKVGGKLKEVATGLPPTTEGEVKETPETEFIEDLKTGTEKANEYLKYIKDAAEYWQKYGKRLEGIDSAIEGLNKISNTLGTVATALGKAKQLVAWLQALHGIAVATSALDLSNSDPVRVQASMDAWTESFKQLQATTRPFAEWAKEHLFELALAGSEAAAKLTLALSYVWVMADLARQGVEVGGKIINDYKARQARKIALGFDELPPEPPPPPLTPGPWLTQQEIKAKAAREEQYRREMESAARRSKALERAKEKFEQEFAAIYLRHRARLKSQVWNAFKAAVKRPSEGGREDPTELWWEAFMPDGNEYYDETLGVEIYTKKDSVTRQEAEIEIDQFKEWSGTKMQCPFFDDLYRGEFKSYLDKHLSASPAH